MYRILFKDRYWTELKWTEFYFLFYFIYPRCYLRVGLLILCLMYSCVLTAFNNKRISINQKKKLSYFGHTARLNSERYPSCCVAWYVSRTRHKGRWRKKWLDNIREDSKVLKVAERLANLFGDLSWTNWADSACRLRRHCQDMKDERRIILMTPPQFTQEIASLWPTVGSILVHYWHSTL